MILFCHNIKQKKVSNDLLIKKSIKRYCELKSICITGEIDICKTEYGKPYIYNCDYIHFSVSHSGEWWVCGVSESSLGIDIQVIYDMDYLQIAEEFYTKDEYAIVMKNDINTFFDIWTMKESYLKYLGVGLAASLKSFSSQGLLDNKWESGISIRKIPFKQGYALAFCAKKDVKLELIEYF